MSYTQRENSEYEAQPNELYTFTRQGNVWRYTSADEDKTANFFLFQSYPIRRSSFQQSQETERGPLTLVMSKQVPFLQQFRSSPPTSVTTLLVQRYHEGVSEYVTVWIGRVTNVVFSEREAEVRCESIYSSIKRPVLRRRYQTGCPHVLYGPQCGVLRANFAVTAELISVRGTTLTSPEFGFFPDNYFNGGYVEWAVGPDTLRRFIISHTNLDITLNLPFATIPGNASVVAYPGCDHTLPTCDTKFNNHENYGGQPFYPKKNPFGGSPIF